MGNQAITTTTTLTGEQKAALSMQIGICRRIIDLFNRGVMLLDEVDLVLHPLKSEVRSAPAQLWPKQHAHVIPTPPVSLHRLGVVVPANLSAPAQLAAGQEGAAPLHQPACPPVWGVCHLVGRNALEGGVASV